jgi:hypothetical protein
MDKQLYKDALGWGFGLWLFGAILGIIFFFVVPRDLIGWAITPFGIAATLWVLFKKIKGEALDYYLKLAIVWTLIAILFDYILMIKLLNSGSGYYQTDIFLYYILTFILPLAVGYYKKEIQK